MLAPPILSRRRLAVLMAAAAAAGCDDSQETDAPEPGSLAWAASGRWRIEPERDPWRHPIATLQFWDLRGNDSVLEVLPGRGWYTAILAPYLAHNGGRLFVASFDPATATPAQRAVLSEFNVRFMRDAALFGRITQTIAAPDAALAPNDSIDLAIMANVLNTLMAQGQAERMLARVFDALKPGGVLGVEQHRAPSNGVQDPLAGSGYVQEPYVKLLAQEAGFEFVAASDVNSNPRDDHEHPFGVWSLPPTLRTSPIGQPANPGFDTAPYAAIGESDRMTLKFRRPEAAGRGNSARHGG